MRTTMPKHPEGTRSRKAGTSVRPRDPESAHSPATGTPCPNCTALLGGLWCSKCGQKWSPLNPTWHDLLHDSIHEFLHLDGKIFRTAWKLFLQPGELTAEFLDGRRIRYIGPLRLYLTFSAIFFLLVALVPNPNLDAQIGLNAEATARELTTETYVVEMLSTLLPKLIFILVPVFAVLLRLVDRREGRNYPQFLYFSLHFHAAVFGFLALTVPLQALPSESWLKVAQGCVLAWAFGYLNVALKRVFDGSVKQALLRASAVSLSYLAVLTTATLCIIFVLLQRAGDH